MADVKIRKLDDRVVEYFKARAVRAGHSLEEELRRYLGEAALRRRQEAIRRADENREALFRKYGVMPDSVELIRDEREEREARIAGD